MCFAGCSQGIQAAIQAAIPNASQVLFARQKWLKPGGAHFPSHAQIFMAPLQTNVHNSRLAEYKEEVNSGPPARGTCMGYYTYYGYTYHGRWLSGPPSGSTWARPTGSTYLVSPRSTGERGHCIYTASTLHVHGLSQAPFPLVALGLDTPFRREQFEYIMQTAQWCQVQGSEIIGGTFEVSSQA